MQGFVEHLEGTTRLLVPSVSLTRVPPPTAPVFFNPVASLNRDVSVAITAASGGSTFCDSMAGVGARGVRVANEVGRIEKVTLVEFNAAALGAAKESAALNRVAGKCEFSDSETTAYLSSRFRGDEKFDCVDVDPFGTPVRQLQAGLGATAGGGILSVTATDTAVLCGVYHRVSERRYGALPLHNHFSHETGIRLLAGVLARTGAQVDVGIEPVFAHSTRHYIRLYVKVAPGASSADETLERLGFVSWCPHCGHTASLDEVQKSCPDCGKKARGAGPIWLRGLTAPKLLRGARESAARLNLPRAAELVGSLEGIDEFPPWSFSIEEASSSLKVATVPEALACQALAEAGWKAMRTPFEKTGVKTDAPYKEFLSAVKSAVSGGRGRP